MQNYDDHFTDVHRLQLVCRGCALDARLESDFRVSFASCSTFPVVSPIVRIQLPYVHKIGLRQGTQYILSLLTGAHLSLLFMATLHAYVVTFSLICPGFWLKKEQTNVLVDGDYTVRLVDFGLASVEGDIPEVLSYLQRSSGEPGAIRWAAPEHFLVGDIQRTTKSDIYSLGNLIFLASPPFIPRISPPHLFPGIVGQIPMVGSTSG